jgi:hypothetical protein
MATQFLSNDYLGPAYTLQPQPHSRTNGLHAAPSRYGGLVWAIVPSPEQLGKFNICTSLKGQPKCLDIYNDGSFDRTRVCLADPGYYSGQTWTLVPQGHGRCKLSNDWTGTGWYLDTYSDSHEAFMSRGDFSGQQWLIAMPSAASVGSYPAHSVATGVPVSVHHSDGNLQVPQNHLDAVGKIEGGFGTVYASHKLWNKLT